MLAFEHLAEEKIRAAIAAGEFDQVPGQGKPLNLDELPGLRPEERMAYTVLKNSGFLPEHLTWRKELEKCLNELEQFQQHCRRRLGKILTRLSILAQEPPPAAKPPSRVSWLRPMALRLTQREQNLDIERGKERGAEARSVTKLRQTYREERRWLRRRLSELAEQAGAAAQQIYQAVVEKEIREHRPLVFLLGPPVVSHQEILAQFDREFPAAPWENNGD
ncbi:MAG: hypothetical protein ALAOOOJD_00562 [bacterium]|nr:hypothetical protein [bacterium]